MSFVHPFLLSGLLLVGIPVLLHLIMRQKPKHLLFPAFRFLQQKMRTNQRKLRLRHLLLLILRMLLIAVLCLALSRPKIFSERLNLVSEQPMQAVLVFDTSLSMEYTAGGKGRLEEAKDRARELLDELPEGSQVAILDGGEPAGGEWMVSLSQARDRIANLQLRPAAGPVTEALAQAYRMLADLDKEGEATEEPRPRFVYVFSDRAQECWDAARTKQLQEVRDRLAPVKVHGVFVDVGADQPADLAIADLELPKQAIPANERVIIRATVQAIGNDFDTEIVCRIDGEKAPERKAVQLKAGQSQVYAFERRGLSPGLHQAEVTLATSDSLPFDNVRYATFEVRGARQVLTLADEPEDADIWRLALDKFGAFHCEVKPTAEATKLTPPSLAEYQAVCLLNVAEPSHDLWEKLHAYVKGGGGLAIIAGEAARREAYNKDEVAQRLLPGTLKTFVAAELEPGATWDASRYQHPVMAPLREWAETTANVDFLQFPPTANHYWQIDPHDAYVIVSYSDKQPALLERNFNKNEVKGRVLLFTTPLDGGRWNDFLQTSFYLVLANKTVSYLAGDSESALFNFRSGQSVPVTFPAAPRFAQYALKGPGLTGSETTVPRPEQGNELRITQPVGPGNFTVEDGDKKVIAGFSLNVAPGECQLVKVPADQIESLLGPGSVLPVGHTSSLREALQSHWNQPVELFPWLMVLLLIALAVENLLANKFYRNEPPTGEQTDRKTA